MGMGLKPSSNFAVIAMKETSKLEDFEAKYPVARKALSEDSYVDNTFVTGKSVEVVKEKNEEINLLPVTGVLNTRSGLFQEKMYPSK